MYADENVIKIKHDVLYEVAKLAFAGELEEKKDYIANQLIPGPAAQFRCCIYKEREIIRQRVRLAEGKAPGPVDDQECFEYAHRQFTLEAFRKRFVEIVTELEK